MTNNLEYYDNCSKCIHKYSCDAWIDHGIMLYDNFTYTTENCPYYQANNDKQMVIFHRRISGSEVLVNPTNIVYITDYGDGSRIYITGNEHSIDVVESVEYIKCCMMEG